MPDGAHKEHYFLRIIDGITQIANIGGSLLIFALVLLIGADVFMRNLFKMPISGVPEMVTLSIVAIVFLQIPQALKAGRMTRSDALINVFMHKFPRVGIALETIYDLFAVGIICVIFYATWPIFLRSWNRSEFIGALGDFTAPTWPVKLLILVGCTLLVLQFLIRIIRRTAIPLKRHT